MRVIAKDLAIRRGEDLIFNNISFAVDGGEALTITGPNGVGKSTLLRGLAGLLPFENGKVRLEPSSDDEKAFAEHCHYVGHKNAMKPELTVLENLTFWQSQMGVSEQSMTPEDAVEAFGLTHTLDLPFAFLSQGQRRRIALTKLFVAHRPIWLLDEPTAALDKSSSGQFDNMVDKHLGAGGIVIAATHVPLGFNQARALEMVPAEPDGVIF